MPLQLPIGKYAVQLSVDGGQSFSVPVIDAGLITDSTLTVADDANPNLDLSAWFNVSVIALAHPYGNLSGTTLAAGFNPGDLQLITWQSPPDAWPYLTLLLFVAYTEWRSTSVSFRSPIVSRPLYVVTNSILTNQSSYLWTVPNITSILDDLKIEPTSVIRLSIHPYYTMLEPTNNQSSFGNRRLLGGNVPTGICGVAIPAGFPEISAICWIIVLCLTHPDKCNPCSNGACDYDCTKSPDGCPPPTPECAMDPSCGLCGPGGCGGGGGSGVAPVEVVALVVTVVGLAIFI